MIFMLCWIHSVILEWLRYAPLGWSKKYEFSESDLVASIQTLDEFINEQNVNQHIQIDSFPFLQIRNIIIENIYGGKIDNAFDLRILWSIVEEFFHEKIFDNNYTIVDSKVG